MSSLNDQHGNRQTDNKGNNGLDFTIQGGPSPSDNSVSNSNKKKKLKKMKVTLSKVCSENRPVRRVNHRDFYLKVNFGKEARQMFSVMELARFNGCHDKDVVDFMCARGYEVGFFKGIDVNSFVEEEKVLFGCGLSKSPSWWFSLFNALCTTGLIESYPFGHLLSVRALCWLHNGSNQLTLKLSWADCLCFFDPKCDTKDKSMLLDTEDGDLVLQLMLGQPVCDPIQLELGREAHQLFYVMSFPFFAKSRISDVISFLRGTPKICKKKFSEEERKHCGCGYSKKYTWWKSFFSLLCDTGYVVKSRDSQRVLLAKRAKDWAAGMEKKLWLTVSHFFFEMTIKEEIGAGVKQPVLVDPSDIHQSNGAFNTLVRVKPVVEHTIIVPVSMQKLTQIKEKKEEKKVPCSEQFAKKALFQTLKSPSFQDKVLQNIIGFLRGTYRKHNLKWLPAEKAFFGCAKSRSFKWWKNLCISFFNDGLFEIPTQEPTSKYYMKSASELLWCMPLKLSTKAENQFKEIMDTTAKDRETVSLSCPPVLGPTIVNLPSVNPSTVFTAPIQKEEDLKAAVNLAIDVSERNGSIEAEKIIQMRRIRLREYMSFMALSIETPLSSAPLTVDCVLEVMVSAVNRLTSQSSREVELGDGRKLILMRYLLSLPMEQFSAYMRHALFGLSFEAIAEKEHCSCEVASQYLADCALLGLPLHLSALNITQEMVCDASVVLRWSAWSFERFVTLMRSLSVDLCIDSKQIKILLSIIRYEYGSGEDIKAIREKFPEINGSLNLVDEGVSEELMKSDVAVKEISSTPGVIKNTRKRKTMNWLNEIITPMHMLQPSMQGPDQRLWSDVPSAAKQNVNKIYCTKK